MIKGDIDLTEDMVFYNEKKEKEIPTLPAIFSGNGIRKTNGWENIATSSSYRTVYNYINDQLNHNTLQIVDNDADLATVTTWMQDNITWTSTDDGNTLTYNIPQITVTTSTSGPIDLSYNITSTADSRYNSIRSSMRSYLNNQISWYNSNNTYSTNVTLTLNGSTYKNSDDYEYLPLFGKPKEKHKGMKSAICRCSLCGKPFIRASKEKHNECKECARNDDVPWRVRNDLKKHDTRDNEVHSIFDYYWSLSDYVADKYRRLKYQNDEDDDIVNDIGINQRYVRFDVRRKKHEDRLIPWLDNLTTRQYNDYLDDLIFDATHEDGESNAERFLTNRSWLRLPT